MPAQLVALNDGPSILVDKPILLVGRHPECDIQIDSRKISRRHCCIAQVEDYLVVRDLDSTNGIRINGVRVIEGRLQTGDELTVGNHRYQVTWDEGRPPARPRTALAPVPPARPAPVMALDAEDDELLEECDEPVALPDPGRNPARGEPYRATPPPPGRPAPEPPKAAAEAESLVIPEDLELLPGSGQFPGVTERKK